MPKKKMADGKYLIPDEVTCGEDSVHLVCIDSITEEISNLCGFPVAVTSANISGQNIITSPQKVIKTFKNDVDFFLIDGDSEYKFSTTILDVRGNHVKVLRKSSEEVYNDLKKNFPLLEQ